MFARVFVNVPLRSGFGITEGRRLGHDDPSLIVCANTPMGVAYERPGLVGVIVGKRGVWARLPSCPIIEDSRM